LISLSEQSEHVESIAKSRAAGYRSRIYRRALFAGHNAINIDGERLVSCKSRGNNERVDRLPVAERATQSRFTVGAIAERFKLIEARGLIYRRPGCAVNAVCDARVKRKARFLTARR